MFKERVLCPNEINDIILNDHTVNIHNNRTHDLRLDFPSLWLIIAPPTSPQFLESHISYSDEYGHESHESPVVDNYPERLIMVR